MSEQDGLPAPQRYWVVGCIMLGVALAGLDSAIANIALPTIAKDLAASDAATVWVVNSYQLATAVCLLPAASLGESIGLKRVYLFGIALFTAASLACAMAPSLDFLVAARLVQGLAGACMAALGGALIRTIYPRALLARGYALIALVVAISAAAGPSLASLVLSVAHWPWLFLINVPTGLAGIALFAAKAPPGQPRPRKLDRLGALLNAGALGLLVTGVDGLDGANQPLAFAELAGGVICGVTLWLQQRRQTVPLLPLDLLRIPLFALSMCTSMCAYAAQILAYVSLPFLFQTVMHRSTVATGLLVTPWPLTTAVAAQVAGRLASRYPASVLGSAGMSVLSTGLLLLASMGPAPADWDIAWRMMVCGVGFGFYQTPNNVTLMTAGPPERSGAASGMLAVARTVGWSFGSALVALIFGVRGGFAAVDCLEVGAGLAAMGAVFSVSRTRARRVPAE